MKDICTFDMRRSNISFSYQINDSIYANKKQVTFEGEDEIKIPVNQETKDLLCVCNTKKDVAASVAGENIKYSGTSPSFNNLLYSSYNSS